MNSNSESDLESDSDRSNDTEIVAEDEESKAPTTLSLCLLTPEVEQLLITLPEYLSGKAKARKDIIKRGVQLLQQARVEAGTPFLPAEIGALPHVSSSHGALA